MFSEGHGNKDRVNEDKPSEEVSVESIFKQVALTSNSEIVYGYDENGNQVAITLVFPGQFENAKEENVQSHIDHSMAWVGAEEQCVADCQIIELTGSDADVNIDHVDYSVDAEIGNGKNKEPQKAKLPIKVYKVNRAARKMLQKMKKSGKRKSKHIPDAK